MKKVFYSLLIALPAILLLAYMNHVPASPYGLKTGTPDIKSINALAFGPDGILFIGDSKGAAVFAVDTRDNSAVEKATAVEIKNIDQKIAAVLGTEAKNITVQDLKVNPISKNIYCAVQSADGTPALLKISNGNVQVVTLKDVAFSKATISNVPAEDAKNKWGGSLRTAAIEDLNFADGKVMLSGLSNQEFASTFRSIPFPFGNTQNASSLEIYHAAHGKYETEAPIETFTVANLQGKPFLIASYTCTPLVIFPMDDLKPGTHVKGRTVGEFGAGNRPLDMITMKKGEDQFLIIANSDRPVMKVKFKDIESYKESLTTQVKEIFSTAGVPYISFPMVNVIQLDKLDASQFVLLQRESNGDLNLHTQNDRLL